jgi:hypothetical protein
MVGWYIANQPTIVVSYGVRIEWKSVFCPHTIHLASCAGRCLVHSGHPHGDSINKPITARSLTHSPHLRPIFVGSNRPPASLGVCGDWVLGSRSWKEPTVLKTTWQFVCCIEGGRVDMLKIRLAGSAQEYVRSRVLCQDHISCKEKNFTTSNKQMNEPSMRLQLCRSYPYPLPVQVAQIGIYLSCAL